MVLVLATGRVSGQSPSPSPTPVVKPKVGNLRFWNMQPVGGSTLELVLVSSAEPQGRVLQTAQAANFYAGYTRLPPGAYTLKVCRVGEHDKPIKSFNVPLRVNSYLTVLVTQPASGPVTAELLDDTPDPTKAPVNRLVVRELCPNIHVQITTASRQQTDVLEFGGMQTLEGLPNGLVPVYMRATLANGVVRTWNTEADFRSSRHASLLVFTDPYGRIRPRVSVDGPSPADEDAVAAEAAAAVAAPTP